MKTALLIVSIVLLLIYAYIMIDSIILVKKSEGKKISDIKDTLMKRINITTWLTVIIFILILIRIIVFK